MEGRTLLRIAIPVLCLAVTALGYENANGDNSEVVALASRTACPTEACSAILSETSRSSTDQHYRFKLDRKTDGKGAKPIAGEALIECKRAFVLVGDWSCQPQGAP